MAEWLYLQLPLVKPYVQFSRIRLTDHLLPEAFTYAWPSGIVPTEVTELFGVYSVAAISFPFLRQERDESIAPSLSQSYVVFEMITVVWATPTPAPTRWNFVSLYPPVAPCRHRCGSPAFIVVWLPLRVVPVTPGVHLSVMAVIVKIDASAFPNVGQGRQLLYVLSRLHPGSLTLQPAGLLSSLSEPLSRNSVLRVTPYTSFKLRG